MDFAEKLNSLRSQPAAYWASAANQHLPQGFTWILVAVIAWYLVKIVWLLIPTDNVIASAPIAAARSVETSQPSIDYPKIAAAHLFGEAGAEPPPVETVNAPETRLNLKLRGAIAAGDPKLAHAIIADGGGKDKVYFVNDKLPGGASLHEVYRDRVILNRGGVLETLRLPKVSKGSGSPQPARRPPAQFTTSDTMPASMGGDEIAFTDVIRPQPFMPNGEMKGYRVYPGRDRRKFAALGLRPGDLVTEINGTLLTDMQSSMETLRDLRTANQIVLSVERGNTSMVLTLDPADFTSMTQDATR
jgi:general secretion pathway protein C